MKRTTNTKTRTNEYGLPGTFRQSGAFNAGGKPVRIFLNNKTNELAFVEEEKWVQDPTRQAELLALFLKANQPEE